MSETDDTDVLLLIPPNFFLVQSSGSEDSLLESSRTVVRKPTSCTALVLDKLVNHVHTLESRLESLEITSDISSVGTVRRPKTWDTTDSFDSKNLDCKSFTFPRRRKRKTFKKRIRNLSLTSLDSASTINKSVPTLKLDYIEPLYSKPAQIINDINSMDGDLSSIVSTPSKKNDKLLLNEIDEFLTKVESYECPEVKYKDQHSTLSPDNVIKATGDYLSQKLDSKSNDDIKLPSGRVLSSSVLDKYIYLVRNSNNNSPKSEVPPSDYKRNEPSTSYNETLTKTNTETKDLCSPIRKLNFDKDVQPTSTPKKETNYLDTFKPSSNKIYDRASKVLEQYKSSYKTQGSMTEYTSPKKEDMKLPQMRPFHQDNKDGIRLAQSKFMESIDTDLLSLSDLWGDKGGGSGKLEEERLKREHCETLIQQLQKKILEQQERLAVAIKVDRGKDAAIAKLREAWLRLTSSLDKAEERHRAALEKMVREVDNFRLVADESQKKTSNFEAELYKALDLAHDYQEKCKLLTAEKKAFEERMDKHLTSKDDVINGKDAEIQMLKDNYETMMRLNKQSTDCVKNLEDALEKEKSEHELTKQKSSEMSKKMQELSDELQLLGQERDLLKDKVGEERSRASVLERQLADKHGQNCELVKQCETLDNDLKTLRKHLELQKTELKTHYQKQLEDAVLAKLQEFQRQLDAAEREMENDTRAKENAIVDAYNKQISRIEEQHKLEINVLEEKQREEMKLYRLQLAQAGERIGLLESKVSSYRRGRGELAARLHAVMQTQWSHALRLLAVPGDVPTIRTDPLQTTPSESYKPAPERGTSESLQLDSLTDTELQQYVKLLLTKPVNLDGSGDTEARELCEEPTSDRPDRDRKDKNLRRSVHSSKPPWKA